MRDSLSRRAVPNATVILLGSRDSAIARAKTDAGGEFSFAPTARASARRVRVLRLGFVPRIMSLDAVSASVDIALVPLPSALDTVRVSSLAGCRAADNPPPAVALWRSLRDELLAGLARAADSAGASTSGSVVTNARWDYAYSTTTLRDTTQLAAFAAARGALERFLARHAAAAADDPLLGDGFIATHCLRLVAGHAAHTGEVAVEFEPARGPDTALAIAGHWWTPSASGRIRSLEFKYLHTHIPGVATTHVWLQYAADDGGAATDADWWMYQEPTRAAALAWRAGNRISNAGYAPSAWDDWSVATESIASPPSVRGVVMSRATGAPLEGVGVALFADSTAIATTVTDTAGLFRFTGLDDRRYRVHAADTSRAGDPSFTADATFELLTHSDWLELESYDGVPFQRLDRPRDSRDWGSRIHPYPPDRARRLTIELGPAPVPRPPN